MTPDLAVFGKALACGLPGLVRRRPADLFGEVGTGQGHARRHVQCVGAGHGRGRRHAADPRATRRRACTSTIERVGTRLRAGLQEVAARHGGERAGPGAAVGFNVSFNPLPETFDHADSARADWPAFRRFVPMLLSRGVRIAGRGNLMLSAAHTDEDVDRTLQAFDGALESRERRVRDVR